MWLPRDVRLHLLLDEPSSVPLSTVSCDDRTVQEAVASRLSGLQKEASGFGKRAQHLHAAVSLNRISLDYPMFEVFSSLQETIVALPLQQDDNVKRVVSPQSEPMPKLSTKCALLWAHHLLAPSKRKDIQQWAAELQVWAIAKTG